MQALSRLLRLATDLFLPAGCARCDRMVASVDGAWCTDCALRIGSLVGAPYCPRCGRTVTEPVSAADGCDLCRERPIGFDGLARAGEYRGAIRDVVLRYKFGRLQRLEAPLGSLVATALERQPWIEEVEAFVPIPTCWSSRRRYSFSPPLGLARQAGRRLNIAVVPILEEHGKRPRQVGLPANKRVTNVIGSFRLRRGARPAGSVLCLIDDVSTTGATLAEAARVLKEAGAIRVYAGVVGKADPASAEPTA